MRQDLVVRENLPHTEKELSHNLRRDETKSLQIDIDPAPSLRTGLDLPTEFIKLIVSITWILNVEQ